jgi:hypothetical protein
LSWIESDVTSWIDGIATQLRKGYTPHDCATCYEPKGGWLVRPGAVLDLGDEVVFNALIGCLHRDIWKSLKWSQGDPDVAYPFQASPKIPEWVKSGFPVWEQWRKKSLAKLVDGTQFVVFADVAGFYENIDLSRVCSDLRGLGADLKIVELLSTCLHRWCQPRGKGIPQGYSASDILAKIYMTSVDRGLRNARFRHLRYVDDFRVFCKTSLEAKTALLALSDLLRHRGLNLQSAKTEILRAGEARRKIDGVAPVIGSIGKQLRDELKMFYKDIGPYGSLADIERFVDLNPKAPPPEVLGVTARPLRRQGEESLTGDEFALRV